MSGDSNNVSQDPFAGLLDENMEEEAVTVNIPPPPTASNVQHSDPPLSSIPPLASSDPPSIPPPETPAAKQRQLDRVAEEPTQVEPVVDPVVTDRGRGRGGPRGRGRAPGRGRRSAP